MANKTDTEEKIIELVREMPCLWDKKCSTYFNTNVKEDGWRQIGVAVKMEPKASQELWGTLRNQYMKYLRKLKNPTGSGRNTRPPYFRHQSSMMFLKDTVDPNESTLSNLNSTSDTETDGLDVDSADPDELPDLEQPSTQNSSNPDQSQQVPRSKPIPQGRSHSKYGNKRRSDNFDSEVLELLKTDEDEFDLYCKMLAPKLRKLSEADRKSFLVLQHNMNTIVHEAEIKSLI